MSERCECHRCIREFGLTAGDGRAPGEAPDWWDRLPLSSTKMILCPECGNKRCPRASDHRLDCTNSNEPFQPGSIYGGSERGRSA